MKTTNMLPVSSEKKLLQVVIAIACFVPLSAGLCGIIRGSGWLSAGTVNLDSHFRYLSGLLLGIGVGFISIIPRIERHTERIRLLTMIVVIGGSGRLLGLFLTGVPNITMLAALGMELVVTPLLCLWQHRLARRFNSSC